LKFIAPKTPQPILNLPQPQWAIEKKGVYQLLVHLWLKSMAIFIRFKLNTGIRISDFAYVHPHELKILFAPKQYLQMTAPTNMTL
jgi:hypothetical protein